MELPTNIKEYLNNRGISDATIKDFDLSWDGKKIVLPVFNKDKKKIFNKYRKSPFSTDEFEPKYTYDKGASSSLFNQHLLNSPVTGVSRELYITEGELDALVICSHGISAVSTTGGSGTFKDEWADAIKVSKLTPVICYDNDEPGVKGAWKLKKLFPDAPLVFIPRSSNCKDVTEFVTKFSWIDFINLPKFSERLPIDLEFKPVTKADWKERKSELAKMADNWLQYQRKLKNSKQEWWYLDVILEELNKEITSIGSRLKTKADKNTYSNSEKAKQVPIDYFIEFNTAGFAPCPFHGEKVGSLKYYPKQNLVHCYGGCGTKNVVQIIMNQKQLSFKQAVDFLLKNYE